VAFILWAVMVFGGFFLAKQYFDQTIMAVQQTNAVNVQTLEARLDNLGANVKEIRESLATAGITLSSSDSTQKELNKKIEELDAQLKNLEKSLNILREAPR
jgi:septation ring formation regulator EzrA